MSGRPPTVDHVTTTSPDLQLPPIGTAPDGTALHRWTDVVHTRPPMSFGDAIVHAMANARDAGIPEPVVALIGRGLGVNRLGDRLVVVIDYDPDDPGNQPPTGVEADLTAALMAAQAKPTTGTVGRVFLAGRTYELVPHEGPRLGFRTVPL